GSVSKKGAVNADAPLDMVAMALQLGASYVGRGFSGDKAQLVPLIKGALTHRGAAFLDVISPCVAFNNHAGSTRSYDWVREHNEAVNRLDVMPPRAEIVADYAPGELIDVQQHDGSVLRLHKLAEDYDPRDRIAAMNLVQQRHARGEIATGLLYVDPGADDLHGHLGTVETPLNALGADALSPGAQALERINASLRWRPLLLARPSVAQLLHVAGCRQPLDDLAGHRAGGQAATVAGQVGGERARFQRRRHRPLHADRLRLQPQRVAQQQGRAEDRADRVGDALAGDVGGRAVDRLVQSRRAFAQRRGRQQAHRAGQHRGLVGEDVAEQVLGDDHVVGARPRQQ